MGRILVGTASWTEPSLLKSGEFYPPGTSTAEEMLRFYSSRFSLVEVDSTYYALPSERNARLWVQRTPEGFVFDIKAFALITTHPAEVQRLPTEVRQSLPPEIGEKERVYPRELPPETMDLVFEMFRSAIRPLYEAGKLGAVFLQFPKWFFPTASNRDYILQCRDRLADYRIAVEFRQSTWFTSANLARTIDFLRDNGIAYVAVDEPQGFRSSVPPITPVTSKELAVVRLHGRNAEAWEKPGLSTTERFNYLYTEEELKEWVPRIQEMSEQAEQVHVIFNNHHGSNAVRNAAQMKQLLGAE